jgi:hypothetical protein
MTEQEIKTKWLEALRSGKYRQVQGTLKGITEDGQEGYCCLGVLLSIQGIEPPVCVAEEKSLNGIDEGPKDLYDRTAEIIGACVQEIGIDMNDSGNTFREIADAIEKRWNRAQV